MSSNDAAETERVIRQKLEASGQYGKMRAMIMEAALQTVQSAASDSNNGSSSANKAPFAPSKALTEAKQNGVTELSIVLEYLHALGLQYTESVLRLEAGLSTTSLKSSAALQEQFGFSESDTCLCALVRGGGHGTADAAGEATTTAATAAAAVEEEPADMDDAASDHDQPGGEDTTYFISNWKQRHFVRFQQVSGQQVQLDRLTDCQTVVLDELDSMTADDCEGGELVIAACEGSVFLRNCKNMTVHVACKQLRTRDCENIDLHIFTTTDPVVEMSHHIHFYPFHLRLPSLRKLFAEARLDARTNRFVHVYDFTPSEPGLPQPHYQVHFPDHGQAMEDRCGSYGAPECPPELEQLLALQLMPAASSESGKNKSYDIKTGAQVWATAGAGAAAAAATAIAAATPAAAAPVVANAVDGSSSSGGANAKTRDTNATAPAGPAAGAVYKDDFDASDSEAHSSVHSSSVSEVASSDEDNDDNSEEEEEEDEEGSGSEVGATAGAQQQQQEPDQKKKTTAVDPMASPAGLPPTAATGVGAAPAGHAATPGGLDNEEYSSFDDDSDAQDADDKYEVDEDEDDF